jgi:hypothetical protein
MKRLLIGSIFILFCVFSSYAQPYKMAGGVRISNKAPVINTSLSFKYFYNESTAVETLLSLGKPWGLGFLLEKHKDLQASGLYWLYGGGAYFSTESGPVGRVAGLQGILGFDYKFPTAPFNLSLDWKPELTVAREFSFEPAAVGISARFTIK